MILASLSLRALVKQTCGATAEINIVAGSEFLALAKPWPHRVENELPLLYVLAPAGQRIGS
jgi:hypothetical protein